MDHGFILRIRAHQRQLPIVTEALGYGMDCKIETIMLAFGRFRVVKGPSHRSQLEPHNQGRFI